MAKDFNVDEAVGVGETVGFGASTLVVSSAADPWPRLQAALLILGAGATSAGVVLYPALTFTVLHWTAWSMFFGAALWRTSLLFVPNARAWPEPLADEALPLYTVIAPLYREAEMVRRLADAICRLDYPRERLQVILALEADDLETQAAARGLPAMFEAVIVPPDCPTTKPRACSYALGRARGEFVVVYDAEDRPDPAQLRQAAARFADADRRVACLQAPLRADLQDTFLPRQFGLEYAALFEVLLPALSRMDAAFPLGGTSNHFRTQALRRVGGWDAYNVTEDADVAFRLVSAGYRLGVIDAPTWELPPVDLNSWMPQRARWLKGYMQTWSVHMRRPMAGGLGRLLMLQGTVGLAIVSALAHGPLVLLLLAGALLSVCAGQAPALVPADAGVLFGGWAAAVAVMAEGARRAGGRMRMRDALFAPAYWLLQSLAMIHAIVQLATCPHHWDKTPHRAPAGEPPVFSCLDAMEREQVSRAA